MRVHHTRINEVIHHLLTLPNGAPAIRRHLNPQEMAADPGHFQAGGDAVAAARAVAQTSNQVAVASRASTKLETWARRPGVYRDESLELGKRLRRAARLHLRRKGVGPCGPAPLKSARPQLRYSLLM